jgi:hypothetical protein
MLSEKNIKQNLNVFESLKSLKKGFGSGVGSGSAPKCQGSPTLVLLVEACLAGRSVSRLLPTLFSAVHKSRGETHSNYVKNAKQKKDKRETEIKLKSLGRSISEPPIYYTCNLIYCA